MLPLLAMMRLSSLKMDRLWISYGDVSVDGTGSTMVINIDGWAYRNVGLVPNGAVLLSYLGRFCRSIFDEQVSRRLCYGLAYRCDGLEFGLAQQEGSVLFKELDMRPLLLTSNRLSLEMLVGVSKLRVSMC